MNVPSVPARSTGLYLQRHGGAPYMPRPASTSSPRPATTSACEHAARRARGRRAPLLPHARGSRRSRSSRWRAPSGSCSAPTTTSGLTGDERVVAGRAGRAERYGTGLTGSRLLNGTIPLHLELEREIAEWMGTEDALVFTTGHQANLGTLGTILGPGDTVDRRLRRPRLDPRRLPAVARQAARLPPQPPGQARERSLERADERRRRRARRRRRRLLDGGRRRAAAGDLRPCERYGARLHGRRGPWRGRRSAARGAGTAELLGVEDRVDLRMGTFSKSLASCGGFVAGPGRRHRLPAHAVARLPVHRLGRARRRRRALAALRVLRSDEGPGC